MATLVSPGASITVTDQSMNLAAGPGTVPLLFIATQENKNDPTGSTVAPGTTKANAGKVYSITSQRDLVQTFGDPVFYSIGGTSINGYPLNEYGLLAAYSYLGISNLCRVIRADIDTAKLAATPIQPTSIATANTWWLDESVSKYGIFKLTSSPLATGGGTGYGDATISTWTSIEPKFVYNFLTGIDNTPDPSDGTTDDVAVVFQTELGQLSYWLRSSEGVWDMLGYGGPSVVFESIWPDVETSLDDGVEYWVKTTSPAKGADLVLRKMSAELLRFVQVESPILVDSAVADEYYSTNASKSNGQVHVQAEIFGESSAPNVLAFMLARAPSESWAPLDVIIGSKTEPTNGPLNGQVWFNALLGIDNDGRSTIDMLYADGNGGWQNVGLPGFDIELSTTAPTLYTQSSNPLSDAVVNTLMPGDIWVDTNELVYPTIRRWSGASWVLIDNTDQVTSNGIIFADARPTPYYVWNDDVYVGANNGGDANPDLDPDAPDSDLYPRGLLLWNTRYSTNNVKEWQSPFVHGGVMAGADNTNNGSQGRWVTTSGNNPGGVPYMGTAAQHIVIVRAIQALIISSDEVRAEDMYFNLLAAPGYVEAIDELLILNEARKQTAFVVGDTPFTLAPNGTALQHWASNAGLAYGNGPDGLTSASKYFGVWYPSGLSTNVDGTDVVVPPSHMALRTIAYNDHVSYPWFAPAGLQRGVVNNAGSVGYVNSSGQYITVKLSEGQRDILYINGINPIRTMPSGGIVVFGQKTRQPYSSATDRINVVRLENYLRFQLDMLVQPFLFEPNDSTTRKAVKDAMDRALSELITLRGLYDFLVVCDLSNNTPARIDRNELWVDIAIAPAKTVEFIYIPIRIKNTGSDLSAA